MAIEIKNTQEDFWSSDFGKEYTDRNSRDTKDWDTFYLDTYGVTKTAINEKTLGNLPKDAKILEVGCNTGMQLVGLQNMGFTNLYGVELQPYAVEQAKKYTQNINIVQGSGFELPFKDNYFDLVCTNGVLIHIAPENHYGFMSEVVRCSKKHIAGFEYFVEGDVENVNYRGNEGFLWKADFCGIYEKSFPNLVIVQKDFYPYVKDKNLVDCMFLLEKSK